MKNKDIRDLFDGKLQCGSRIDEIIWVAGVGDNWKKIDDFFYSIGYNEIVEMFPDYWECDVSEYLITTEKFGFIAEVHHPKVYNIAYFADGRPKSWSVNEGTCRVSYLYAETVAGLVSAIRKADKKAFQYWAEKDKNK